MKTNLELHLLLYAVYSFIQSMKGKAFIIITLHDTFKGGSLSMAGRIITAGTYKVSRQRKTVLLKIANSQFKNIHMEI